MSIAILTLFQRAGNNMGKSENISAQEPMSRSMQLHYIPVTAFSWADLFLDRISSELDSHGSAMTNH